MCVRGERELSECLSREMCLCAREGGCLSKKKVCEGGKRVSEPRNVGGMVFSEMYGKGAKKMFFLSFLFPFVQMLLLGSPFKVARAKEEPKKRASLYN